VFIRQKKNKSGVVSIQIIDKSSGKYKVHKTIGSSKLSSEIQILLKQANSYLKDYSGQQEIDFSNTDKLIREVLNNIISHKLVGIDLILGKIFDDIGFNQIQDELFRDLVLYRLVYPKSKLKTTEYLYRFSGKDYSEDDIYRYMDRLHNTQKEIVQKISYEHSKKVLGEDFQVVFYDVTTLHFEIDREDDFRKTGFSKAGKHQNPQIVLGLLVDKQGYPLAYEIFEGNKFEGHTMLPVLNTFKKRYDLKQLIVVADSGLLSKDNIEKLISNNYEFILGARIKNEPQNIKDKILSLKLNNGGSRVIKKGDLRLIVTFSDDRKKLLSVSDFFADPFCDKLKELQIASLKKAGHNLDEFWLENLQCLGNFYILEAGMIFHYNQYEIASYATGPIDVFISFEEIMPLLKHPQKFKPISQISN
jgi:transposase